MASIVEFLTARLEEDEQSEMRRRRRLWNRRKAYRIRSNKALATIGVHRMTLRVADLVARPYADALRSGLAMVYDNHPDYQEEWDPMAVAMATRRKAPREDR